MKVIMMIMPARRCLLESGEEINSAQLHKDFPRFIDFLISGIERNTREKHRWGETRGGHFWPSGMEVFGH